MPSTTALLREACRALERLEDIEGIELFSPALRKWWRRAKRKSPATPYNAPQYWASPEDRPRLRGRMRAVFRAMKDGEWWTLNELCELGGVPTGTSSRLRDLRKPQFGGYNIQRRMMGGVNRYRLKL